MKIKYDPVKGISTPDGLAERQAKDIASGDVEQDSTSSSLVIYHLCALKMEGKINDLVVVFDGKELTLQPHGVFSEYPDGFMDHAEKVCSKLLQLRIENSQA